MKVRYDKYFKYVCRHKWFVMKECFKVGLYWRGLIHDLDKFYPSAFISYSKRFYGNGNDISTGRDSTGYYNPMENSELDFQLSLKDHVTKNKHHWQYWVLPTSANNEKMVLFNMDLKSIFEMICDWKGAARAQGNMNYDPKEWFKIHDKNMILSEESKNSIMVILNLLSIGTTIK